MKRPVWTGLDRFFPVFSGPWTAKDRSGLRSMPLRSKDRTGPDFQTLVKGVRDKLDGEDEEDGGGASQMTKLGYKPMENKGNHSLAQSKGAERAETMWKSREEEEKANGTRAIDKEPRVLFLDATSTHAQQTDRDQQATHDRIHTM